MYLSHTENSMSYSSRKAADPDYQRMAEITASGAGGLGSTLIGVAVVTTAVATAPVSAPIAAVGGICIGAGGAAIAHAIRLSK